MRILKPQNHTVDNNYSPIFALHGRIILGDLKRALYCLAFLTWGMVWVQKIVIRLSDLTEPV